MFTGQARGWQNDPDHKFGRVFVQPQPVQPAAPGMPPYGVAFANGIAGARSDGVRFVLEDLATVAAGRRRAMQAIATATTTGIPPTLATGSLPPGVHAATRGEFLLRFAGGSPERAVLATQLDVLSAALADVGVSHVVVGGSYAGTKTVPNDIDLAWVPTASTTTDAVDAAFAKVRHLVPGVSSFNRIDRIVLNAPTLKGSRPGEVFLELFQHDKFGTPRGVVLLATRQSPLGAGALPTGAARRSIVDHALAGLRAIATT